MTTAAKFVEKLRFGNSKQALFRQRQFKPVKTHRFDGNEWKVFRDNSAIWYREGQGPRTVHAVPKFDTNKSNPKRKTHKVSRARKNPFSGHFIVGKDSKGGTWYYDGDKGFSRSRGAAHAYSSHTTAYHTAQRIQRLLNKRRPASTIKYLEIRK